MMKLVLLVFGFTTAVSVNVDKCCPLNRKIHEKNCFADSICVLDILNSRVFVFGLYFPPGRFFMLKMYYILTETELSSVTLTI